MNIMEGSEKIDELQKGNLIIDEIKKGELDEKSIKPQDKSFKFSLTSKKIIGDEKKKARPKKKEICQAKLYAREADKAPKTIRVPVYGKPCTIPKRNYIPRNCMTKEERMTFLSTPSRKCLPQLRIMKEKTLKTLPARINELAQPPRQRMIATLKDRGTVLPIKLVDRLITALEAESCLTPEQVEPLFRGKQKKTKRKVKKIPRKQKSGISTPIEHQVSFDRDATMCQYSMAEAFVKSILQWECTIPKEEFQDITEVILNRLKKLFQHAFVDEDERGYQQMHLLADIVASWIAGVLIEVGVQQEDELKRQFKERKKKLKNDMDDDDDNSSVFDTETTTDDDSTMSDNQDGDNSASDNNDHDKNNSNLNLNHRSNDRSSDGTDLRGVENREENDD